MLKLPEATIKFYIEKPELFENRQQNLREMFEYHLRKKRPDEKTQKDFIMEATYETEGEWLYIKHRIDLENSPLIDEEIKKFQSFTKAMQTFASYWTVLTPEDFTKFL